MVRDGHISVPIFAYAKTRAGMGSCSRVAEKPTGRKYMTASRRADFGSAVLRVAGPILCALLVAACPGRSLASPGLQLFDGQSARSDSGVTSLIFGVPIASFSSAAHPVAGAFDADAATASAELRRVAGAEQSVAGADSNDPSSFVSAAVFESTPAPSIETSPAMTNEPVSGAIAGLAFQVFPEHAAAAEAASDLQTANGVADLWPGASRPLFAFENVPAASGVSVAQQLDSIALGDPNEGPLLSAAGDIPLKTSPQSSLSDAFGGDPRFGQSAREPAVQLDLPLTLGTVDARLSLSGRSVRETRLNGLTAEAFSAPAVASLAPLDEQLQGGVNVGVPVFKHQVQVSLDGVFSRLINDPDQAIADGSDDAPPPALGLYGSANAPATSALAGLSAYQNIATGRQYVGTYSVALPIGKALTANMQYVDQRFGGDPLSALNSGVNLEQTTSTFGVLYKIPNTNAAINLNFNQSTFENDQLPGYNWVQNRQNLFFTVKF